jgi:hypothetical protein
VSHFPESIERKNRSVKDTGIKNIEIAAATRYPIVSAYEYEFPERRGRSAAAHSGCTIYFILQRPLTYFTNVIEDRRPLLRDDCLHDPANTQ